MSHRLTVLVYALVAMLVVACGQQSEDPAVLAAEDVFEDDLVVTADPSGTSAVVSVTTSMEMVCAVVYGTTSELGGGIATDSDMGGGAHTDHEAFLAGLEPDTEYFFRVQGTGADGSLYRSELMTFRTPTAGTAEPPGENVAAGATVAAVSSEFSEAFAAENAVDGDLATEWSTAGDGDDASITIDLGEPVDVAGIGFRSREMSDGSAVISTFTVTVDDGETFGPFVAGAGTSIIDVKFTGQVLRFDAAETTDGNTGAAEIEIYH